MCCLVQVAMSVWGIVTLATGQFVVSRTRVVLGRPAVLIGVILTSTFPVMVGIGFFFGVVGGFLGAFDGGQIPEDLRLTFLALDVVGVLLILAIVYAIALMNNQPRVPRHPGTTPPPLNPFSPPPPPGYAPPDPNNPYASPRNDGIR